MEDRSRRRARLVLIVGILIAVLAGVMTYVTTSGSKSEAPPPPVATTPVVVAARDLPPRTALTAADLRVAKYPVDLAPPTAIAKAEDVVGKIVQTAIVAGEPILAGRFAAAGAVSFTVFPPNAQPLPNQPIPAGTPNYRVMTITVGDTDAVGGVVQPGDIVDILLTWQIDPVKNFTGAKDPNSYADTITKITLQNVLILARAGSVYTIRTDAETAEQIAYLRAAGSQMMFLLRAAQDQRQVTTVGGTFGPVFKRFGFPIPAKIAP